MKCIGPMGSAKVLALIGILITYGLMVAESTENSISTEIHVGTVNEGLKIAPESDLLYQDTTSYNAVHDVGLKGDKRSAEDSSWSIVHATNEPKNLTGTWRCDNEARYAFRQIGDVFWWQGSSASDNWSNLAHGKIKSQFIYIENADVPDGRTYGDLVLKIVTDDEIWAVSGTENHRGSVWQRVNVSQEEGASSRVALYRWWNGQAKDHFYTTDPSGELAEERGYVSEGITGYVYSNHAPGTVPLYRWYSSRFHDHFYTTDPSGEFASSRGYALEGTTGYIATSQLPGTTPLYRWYSGEQAEVPSGSLDRIIQSSFFRWFNSRSHDHFYTTDSLGELATIKGYIYEGITGYIWKDGESQE